MRYIQTEREKVSAGCPGLVPCYLQVRVGRWLPVSTWAAVGEDRAAVAAGHFRPGDGRSRPSY